jgi:hypothetical protein
MKQADHKQKWELDVLNATTYLRRYSARDLRRAFQKDSESYLRVYPIPNPWGTVMFGLSLVEMYRRGMLKVTGGRGKS